jgi:hypothetical protein
MEELKNFNISIVRKQKIDKAIEIAISTNKSNTLPKLRDAELVIYNDLYRDLVSPNGIQMFIGLDKHILSLISFFEENEEYEKCSDLVVVLNWYNSQLIDVV